MHPTLRRAGALAVAVLALMPISSARAMPLSAGNAVMLRYRFIAGQTYAYRVAVNMRMSMSGTGVPTSQGNESITLSNTVRFHIVRVDALGGADAEVSLGKASMSMTMGGQTTTGTLPSPRPSVVHINANGSMRETVGSSISAYDLEALGSLPSRAVAPGARWTSTAVANLPSTLGTTLAPMHMTAQNVFSRYLQLDGRRVAAIDTTGALQYITDTSLGGRPVHMHLTARMIGRSLFGVAVHRTVSSHVDTDMRMFMSGRTPTGATEGVNMHIVMSVSLTPKGW